MNFDKTSIMLLAACLAFGAALTTGCATQTVVATDAGQKDSPIPGEAKSELTKTDSAQLTVLVAATPENDEAAALAKRIQTAAEAVVVGNGFTVATKKPDILLALSVRQSTFDKSGDYLMLEGSVPSAKVLLPVKDGKVVSVKEFPSMRGERLLGMEKAVASLGDRLVPDVEKWAKDTVRPANFNMAAITVTLKRNTLLFKSKDPVYVNRFVETVAEVDGVYSCELVAGDATSRLWTFRIAYDKPKFPGGMVNKVIETCRKLDLELDR